MLATVLILIPVGMILVYIALKGFQTMNWEFLTSSQPFSLRRTGGGFLNGLIGTAIMVGLATVVSVPLGIFGAVYLVEYGKGNWLAKLIRFFADVMTGVPSIFVGLFVYTALVVSFGFSALMGAASLAIIMMPIVLRSTEEMLKLVPSELKDASYGLGRRQVADHHQGHHPVGRAGHHHRRHAGHRPRRRRDRAPAAHCAGFHPADGQASGAGPSRRCRWPSSTAPATRSRPDRPGPGRGRSNCIIIILVFTIVARVISSRSRISR